MVYCWCLIIAGVWWLLMVVFRCFSMIIFSYRILQKAIFRVPYSTGPPAEQDPAEQDPPLKKKIQRKRNNKHQMRFDDLFSMLLYLKSTHKSHFSKIQLMWRTDGRTDRYAFLKRCKAHLKRDQEQKRKTRPDTRHKMRLVCVLFTFENNTDGPTDRRTDGWTDTISYRDA